MTCAADYLTRFDDAANISAITLGGWPRTMVTAVNAPNIMRARYFLPISRLCKDFDARLSLDFSRR